jgi:hypothetical protein
MVQVPLRDRFAPSWFAHPDQAHWVIGGEVIRKAEPTCHRAAFSQHTQVYALSSFDESFEENLS